MTKTELKLENAVLRTLLAELRESIDVALVDVDDIGDCDIEEEAESEGTE